MDIVAHEYLQYRYVQKYVNIKKNKKNKNIWLKPITDASTS